MGILDFIFSILALAVMLFLGTGAICMKYNTEKIQKENTELKKQLNKARLKKSTEEYKKVKEVKNDK